MRRSNNNGRTIIHTTSIVNNNNKKCCYYLIFLFVVSIIGFLKLGFKIQEIDTINSSVDHTILKKDSNNNNESYFFDDKKEEKDVQDFLHSIDNDSIHYHPLYDLLDISSDPKIQIQIRPTFTISHYNDSSYHNNNNNNTINSHDTSSSSRHRQKFVDKYCNLQNMTKQDWLFPFPPSSSNSSSEHQNQWINNNNKRYYNNIPYFMIIGSKKSGTTSLTRHLSKHPNITTGSKKELLFFLESQDKTKVRSSTFLGENNNKMLVEEARNAYTKEFLQVGSRNKNNNNNHHNHYDNTLFFDATPDYLYYSTSIPNQVLCVCPWIKVIVILRDPVERAFSNYNFYKSKNSAKFNNMSFEDWIYDDIQKLHKYGLITYYMNTTTNNSNITSNNDITNDDHQHQQQQSQTSLYEQWSKYTHDRHANKSIGRGLYAIQLLHWIQSLQELLLMMDDDDDGSNKKDSKPSSSLSSSSSSSRLLIVRFEDAITDGKMIFDSIIQFLQLPPYNNLTREQQIFSHTMVTNYTKILGGGGKRKKPTMNPKTQKIIQELYKPFNEQLSNLLGISSSYWNYDDDDDDSIDDDKKDDGLPSNKRTVYIWPPKIT